jgi:SAM-dependent methyltransferase
MLLSCIGRFAQASQRERFDVVDFGCADGAMLGAVARLLEARRGNCTGLDVFRSGLPMSSGQAPPMVFLKVDLFEQLPYPLPEASHDIAIVSAFLKHHPEPQRFLGEVGRILRPGGVAVLLDPRPLVVRVGMLFGRFSPRYNPSLWNHTKIRNMLKAAPATGLKVEHFERYWVAPTHATYRLGIERKLPRLVLNLCALHQCLVLRKD